MEEHNLAVIAKRLERVEEMTKEHQVIIFGDGEKPGHAARILTLEEFSKVTKSLVKWAVLAALSGTGALLWSMARDFIASGGGKP